ncbi:MAG: ABC transporter permease [Chitinophagales bacterium]|nr:ABC transporter permease [Chitinophagales bacterium]
MKPEFFVVRKIAFSGSSTFSAFIIRIAVAAVALSLCTMIVATAMITGFQKEIRNKVLGFWSHLQITPFSLTSSLEEKGIYRYQDFYTDKTLLPEVRHIQVTALKGGLLKTKDEFEGVVLKGVGDDFDWKNFEPYLKRGRSISPPVEGTRSDIIISSATAKRLQIDTGDKLTVTFMEQSIRQRPFKICGIYETGLEEFDLKYALVNIEVIQELNHWGKDTVGGFEVFLKEGNLFKSRSKAYLLALFGALLSAEQQQGLAMDPLEKIGEEVYSKISNPALDVQTIKSISPGIFDWLELQTMNELIILTLMLLVAAINMITTLLILILERTNMIGILKALGAANVSIRKIFVLYSAVIVSIGLLIGNATGLAICFIQKHFQLLKLPPDSYYLTHAPIEISWTWIAALNVGTVVITLLLLLLPTALVARISPVKAIRFE